MNNYNSNRDIENNLNNQDNFNDSDVSRMSLGSVLLFSFILMILAAIVITFIVRAYIIAFD
ncbi:hypothetical protein [Acanthamoeba castellanii mimivirus]|jgi:hypothetical protein|uniref:Uncharacterized protein n=2 Tax=Mimivirus TaxID=315393 RepID=E3VYV6_MIMIV|nr:hypothetical protein MIMI_gp0579 [Acanthamoeba polyphaga mimivirus]AEQ60733.1 hypothetical protein [Acanthamoeba castellanii mamavirus]AHA45313.1 hypothetical protein HIRU_S407 [Hirudovirus strain Sangsue]QTF49460.1 hypothetical protein [Mimivirus reunion]WMV61903.1 hypothetical protein qu_569 [Mimivirus sp.]BAV61650.1 hypothetical protein [Acanthamoeba castellanii mimivirus]